MVDHQRIIALVLLASCAAILCLLPMELHPHSASELLDTKSSSNQIVLQNANLDRTALLTKMRSLLKDQIENQHMLGSKVQALIAASAMKQNGADALKQHSSEASFEALATVRNWKKMRPEWKPYDPTKSLAANRAENSESTWGSREDELSTAAGKKSAQKGSLPPKGGLDFARYEARMHHLHGHAPCKDWGNHPIDCIREAYDNHLKGTKFAALQRRYDGTVTDDSLKRERSIIDKKVATGLLSGQLPVPKHGAVHRWVTKQEAARRAAEKAALNAAVRKADATELRRLTREAITKEWGTGLATEGPDAGRRYYINYKTHSTSWDAPADVKRALKDASHEAKVAALRGAVRESQLYEDGFRAGAAGLEAAPAVAGPPRAAAMQVLAAERRAADRALGHFLERRDGVKHAFQLPHALPSNRDLAGERRRIARLLGVQHLVHKDPEDYTFHVPPALAAAEEPRRESLGLVAVPVQSKVIVDAWGHPVTSRPDASDYPTGQPASPAPAVQGAAPSSAPDSAPAVTANGSPNAATGAAAAAAVAKAYEDEADAANAKAAALQEEVAVQKALIDDLERQMHAPASSIATAAPAVSAAVAPRNAAAAAAVPLPAVVAAATNEGAGSRALGSFEMADFANSDQGGMMGTDVAYLSSSPYLTSGAAKPEVGTATAAEAAVKELDEDAAQLAADRAQAAADAAAAAGQEGELGTIGAAAAVPLTGEAGADESPSQVMAAPEADVPAGEGSVAPDGAEDEKPELGSWEMAKFANNVEAGGGSLGTNVAWMYDSLAKRGHYHEVEDSTGGNDDGFMEYKAQPVKGAAGAAKTPVLVQEEQAQHLGAEVNERQGGPISI